MKAARPWFAQGLVEITAKRGEKHGLDRPNHLRADPGAPVAAILESELIVSRIAVTFTAPMVQDCIFDNRALFSHRAMAGILGVILRLPPTKQVLANQQVKSRYLARLLEHVAV